jgi:8-oxo-dGTP diphosphatase
MAEDLGEEMFLQRAGLAVGNGLRLIQLREKSFAPERLRRFANRLLPIADRDGARVLLNGDAATARELGCAGVHLTAAALRESVERPSGLLCAASCHDAEDLLLAARLGVDFAVLGPVAATPSHRDGVPLGWERWAQLVEGTPLPVYALGGLAAEDLGVALAHGAHGVALRRAAWPA